MLGSGSTRTVFSLAVFGQVKDGKETTDINARPDDELVSMTRSGKQKAFEVLVRRYQKLVYNVIYQMVRSHESAADLTQDTFLKAYKALPTFDTTRSFKPWLLKIATNSTLNSIRDSKGSQSLEELLELNPHAEPASHEDVEQEVEWRVSQNMLFDALGKIPVRQRQVFVLRYQQDLPYEDIAEATSMTVSSVKSLLFRARDNLREILSKEMEVNLERR